MTDIRYPVYRGVPMSRKYVGKTGPGDETFDDVGPEENWSNAHHIAISRVRHLKNIESSNELLRLLNLHHGFQKGFSDGYSPDGDLVK